MMLLTRVNYRFAFIVHGLQLSLHLIRRSAGLSACFVHETTVIQRSVRCWGLCKGLYVVSSSYG